MEKNSFASKSSSFNDRSGSSKKEKSTRLSKSSSFSVHVDRRLPRPPQRTRSSNDAVLIQAASDVKEIENGGEVEEVHHQPTLEELNEEIDGIIEKLSSMEDNSNLPGISWTVETFAKMVQVEIERYDSSESTLKFGQDVDQNNVLINSVSRLSKLSNLLSKFSSDENVKKLSSSLSLTTLVVQRAMTFMEEELRIILEDSTNPSRRSSAKPEATDSNEEGSEEDKYPMIGEESISNMRKIGSLMISAGYETECCQVYSVLRRNAFKEAMQREGFEKLSIDEVQKMQWESLEGHIGNWIKIVKYVANVLLPGEKKLCDSVFSNEHPSISDAMFSNLARSAVILFLNFAEAISLTKRSAERLFKVIDIYDTLTDLITALDKMCSKECANELRSELSSVRRRLGEAAVCIFCDLENSIKNDVARNLVPGGAVHPLTRYTMNYLWYACDFKDSLEQVFSLHHITGLNLEALEPRREHQDEEDNHNNKNQGPKQTPFAAELMTIMSLLDANLEAKSKLYKDPSLRYIFLMNNGRYILQKIKESAEIHDLVGNNFCRKRSSELRGYHKSYQRETWSRVLQCLNQEGLQVNNKVQKPVLKERFKAFNQMFDEIHKTQSAWVVSDEQLQSELRVSISAVMIPAYRSFLARFGQHFTHGRQREKYIKYQPEDIESTIEELFDGNQNLSMARRKN
ncbi:exocyst complex component EXO70B1-like [Chenopodium quinoa]|uniref:Exocyst subunit Exo70 family protein n=1 Tax=Chenopodium quinoa TaxID=63459 RepID=A0A803L1D6_CHEQI|nr:exocyst complex component EXO70B1-like [Chenopodium quinoa]